MNETNTKLTIEIPIAVHTELKTLAAANRTSVKALLLRGVELVKRELAHPTPEKREG